MSEVKNVGGRPSKRKVKITEEGLIDMLTDASYAIEDTLTKARSNYVSLKNKTKAMEDEAVLGKHKTDNLRIINDCIKGKLEIAKIISDNLRTNAINKTANIGDEISKVKESLTLEEMDIIRKKYNL